MAPPASERRGLVTRLIARAVGFAAGVFFEVEREGPEVPEGPVIVAANHPNSLLDPILILRTAGRAPRPLAKAPLFDQVLVGAALRGLGALPVYRRQDDPGQMHRNERTFDAAIEALHRGGALQIFPEGTTHSEPSMTPLRTGTARIAFLAEERRGWELGLRIVPVGLTYTRKSLFRGRALVRYGEPILPRALRSAYEADPAEAVRTLTDRIAAALHGLTLNFAEREDSDLIEVAERLYAREKGWVGWREREPLSARFPRLREFGRGLAWLRLHDPERHDRLRRQVSAYRRKLTLMGAVEGDVPPEYRTGAAVMHLVRNTVALGLGMPLAAAGTVLFYPTYLLPRVLVKLARPPFEAVSTFKLAAGMVVAPSLYVGWGLLAWWLWGRTGAIVAALVLPPLGLVAVAWQARWRRLTEDIVLWWRSISRPRRQQTLARMRAELVEEFDDLARRMGPPPDRPG